MNATRPDLREARRLLDVGMRIVKLKPMLKAPEGDNWNHRPATSIDPDATGYGLLLEANKVCSIDPDRADLAVIGMRALGFDLEQIMAAGVRTRSTRPDSGGRSAFAAEGEICWLKFRSKATGTVIEFRAHSENLQDTIPGLIYATKDGVICTQTYANGKRLDDVPPLPDDLFAWWEKCATDIEFLREQERMFFDAIGTKAQESISTGKTGGKLAFDAPGIRGPFNRANEVPVILTRHGYGYDRKTRRWFPPTATGQPGVRPVPGKDGLWSSDHASDPLSGVFDAWVAHVVLDHKGDLPAAVSQWKKDHPQNAQEGHQEADGGPAAGGPHVTPDPMAALGQWFVTDEQVQQMKDTRLIWRDIIAASHLSVWSAPGNGGKTTLARFAAGELAQAGHKVLFFQEDASAGDLPALHRHAKLHGYQLLNSTLTGSAPEDQIKVLRTLARDGADLAEFVLFFDTLKKYTDLMSKGGARAFFNLMRALTQRGAAPVLLGHTNKHKGLDGKLIFEGVGDVRNDVDELFYIEATDKDAAGVVTLTMKPDKWRCQVREATFLLDTNTMLVSPSDEVVDVAGIVGRQRQMERDTAVIVAVRHALRHGGLHIVKLTEQVSRDTAIGFKAVRAVIDRYASDDVADADALWIKTYMRINNVIHVSLPPRAAP